MLKSDVANENVVLFENDIYDDVQLDLLFPIKEKGGFPIPQIHESLAAY